MRVNAIFSKFRKQDKAVVERAKKSEVVKAKKLLPFDQKVYVSRKDCRRVQALPMLCMTYCVVMIKQGPELFSPGSSIVSAVALLACVFSVVLMPRAAVYLYPPPMLASYFIEFLDLLDLCNK